MAESESVQTDKPQLPPVNFTSLISEFALAASAHLGQLRTSETEEITIDLGMARRMIDTIELLKEKSQGNLTESEGEFLESTLYNLRMVYVRAAQNPQSTAQPSGSEETNREATSNTTSDDVNV
ncbi:MAG: DUF1844 domain-containing protein [Candidatus Poribacteria bacterium]|nr:DUF1844 domain-containing protein [Candidatus Poribacteria bacterium]MDE0506524.1 DUF1844 domain-containing protein [Candidatus Poribacteria bacterium]